MLAICQCYLNVNCNPSMKNFNIAYIQFVRSFISVDTTPVLVLDNGSATLKVGFSNQAMPKEIVSSVVGTPLRYSQDISGMEYSAKPGLVFGSEAIGKAGVLHIGRF